MRTSVFPKPLIRRAFVVGIVAVIPVWFAACSGDPIGGTRPAVDHIDLDVGPRGMEVGRTLQLNAMAVDASGKRMPDRVIEWSSDNHAVATVTQTGTVSGISPGSANITMASEGKSRVLEVLVFPVTAVTIELLPSSFTIAAGASRQLTVQMHDRAGNLLTDARQATWQSSDHAVATVSQTGLVQGVGAGTAIITVNTEGRWRTSTATVTAASGN